jgi:hypothetical protein
MAYEGWDFILALNFAVSALSTAGLVTPTCNGVDASHCSLTDSRAAYLGIYLMIGVPLYTVTLGQFAGKPSPHAANELIPQRRVVTVSCCLYFITHPRKRMTGLVVEHAARRRAMERMTQPIEANQFKFAATLLSTSESNTLKLGESNKLESKLRSGLIH